MRAAFAQATLSPCMMCAGAIVQFGIPRVVIGEAETFTGNIDFLKSHNVVAADSAVADGSHQRTDGAKC